MNVENCLRDWLLKVRSGARHRGKCLFFDQAPLFVVVAPLLPAVIFQDCVTEAIGDGYGDPIDLDPCDEEQTARLEAAILEGLLDLSIKEVLTIEYIGWPSGLQESLCLCSLGNIDLILMYQSNDVPAFMVFGLGHGDELLKQVIQDGDLLLPRLDHEHAQPVQVAVHTPLPWTYNDVLECVYNLTGFSIHTEQIIGCERLFGKMCLDENPEAGE